MKIGQLIEYNMKNHIQNVAQKLVPGPFLKCQKLGISPDQSSKVLKVD